MATVGEESDEPFANVSDRSLGVHRSAEGKGSNVLLVCLVPIRIDLSKPRPFLWQVFQGKDRRDGASRNTGTTIDAFIRFNVQLLELLERGLILLRMDAIDRANIHACRILRTNARFSDYIDHNKLLLGSETQKFEKSLKPFSNPLP